MRFIKVSPEIHAGLPYAAAVPLHQMIAKNTGIRRASGQFVLATNLDIIFSEELMRLLSSRRLERRTMYRIDRHDVASSVATSRTLEELLESCRNNVLRVHAREGLFDLSENGCRKPAPNDITAVTHGIVLGKGWYQPENYGDEPFRWIEHAAELCLEPPEKSLDLMLDVEVGPSAGGSIRLRIEDPAGRVLAAQNIQGRHQLALQMPRNLNRTEVRLRYHCANLPLKGDPRFLNLRVFKLDWTKPSGLGLRYIRLNNWRLEKKGSEPARDWAGSDQAPSSPLASQIKEAAHLHTNTCGDFTLLSREDWFALRGYPEFPIWPMHIDSLFCYSAHHAGIREIVLEEPVRIYHIEHLSGAGWTPEGEHERTARVEAKKVPVIEYADITRLISHMRRLDAPMIFNLEDWGLASEALSETTI